MLILTGCHSRKTSSLQKIYDQAQLRLNEGELNHALNVVDSGLQKVSPGEVYWHWKLIALKAEILMQERHTKEALALLEPDLPPALADTDVDVRRKMTLGIANAYNLNFAQGAKFLDDAEILAKTKHPELLGDVVLREGTLALTKGENVIASSRYRAALDLARNEKNQYLEVASLGSLGLVAARQEHYDESMEWNRQALERAVAIHAGSSEARIQGNLGWSYLELGEYEQALDSLEKARAAAERAGIVRLQIDALNNSGNVYHYQRNYELAKSSFQSALAISNSISDKSAMAQCYGNLALLNLATGDLESAQKDEEQLAAFVRQYPDRSLELHSMLVEGHLDQARKRYKESEALFQGVIQDGVATASQRWEAELRLAETYGFENRAASAEREYRRALLTIDQARSTLGTEELRLSFLSTPIAVYDSYIEFMLKHSRSREALQVAERSRGLTLEEGLSAGTRRSFSILQSVSPEAIARRLGSTLLFYWLGEQHAYLWVITPNKTTYFVLPKSGDLAGLVKTYRQEILDGRDVLSAGSTAGAELYSTLVQPAEELIPKGSRVILLPTASLYGLNFESLIVRDPKPHFWIEDVILTIGSSLTLLASSPPKVPAKNRNLLLVGNADSPNSDFPSLAEAPAEMAMIAGHFRKAQEEVLAGKRATPSAYLQSNPAQYSYVHFVAHGTASQTRPLESAVILSKEGDTYKLYAREIVKHPLTAELVTISACNGAGTRAYAGEGLVGLSWAFLRAGARNVIASLWEVSDASSTPQLMEELYRGLDRGEDPAIALRNAKLSLLKSSTGTVFARPFYWATFQLYAGS